MNAYFALQADFSLREVMATSPEEVEGIRVVPVPSATAVWIRAMLNIRPMTAEELETAAPYQIIKPYVRPTLAAMEYIGDVCTDGAVHFVRVVESY